MNLKHLRELAEMATKGPWFRCRHNDEVDSLIVDSRPSQIGPYSYYKKGNEILFQAFKDTLGQAEINAEYVAEASPETVIKLLDLIDEMKGVLEFYASDKQWTIEEIGSMTRPLSWRKIDKDKGRKARVAIERLKENT